MKEYRRYPIHPPAPTMGGKRGVVVRPGETLSLPVDVQESPHPVRRRLRIVGEVDLFWQWRCEAGMPFLYRSIVDALCTEYACGEKYALRLHGNGESWPRNAFQKISAAGLPRQLTFAAMVRGEALSRAAGGEVVAELGIYRASAWRHPDDVCDAPAELVRLEVPDGTFEWRELSLPVSLPDDAATLLVRIGAHGFSGTVWFGSPRLYPPGGDTVAPPLMPETALPEWGRLAWLGENLSRVEWPEFAIRFADREVFREPVFNAIVRGADFEIPLPACAPGRYAIDVTLLADYPTALPFVLMAAEVLEESARPVELVGYPEYVTEHRPFGVLVEWNAGEESRLEAIQIDAGPARAHPEYALELGGETLAITPERVVRQDGDDILLSTGDAIYIPQDSDDMGRYLAWYVRERVGNGVCFRPVYRWCGSREVNRAAWERIVPLLEGMGLRYHLMVDGRELPGRSANPPDDLLAGPNYLGRQAHERDGAYNYWGAPDYPSLYADIFRRGQQDGGIFMIARPTARSNGQSQVYFDPYYAADMRQASDYFVRNLAAVRGSVRRHTGPSAQFGYFYQAGYRWQGAEQMYGPEEVILAALRGASRAVGQPDYGAHLAVQWSSAPQDTPAHAARYFLSLATCYLQGVSQINTEEGLWRMESEYAAHDRFSRCCQRHREAHARFRRFLQTHPRRGIQRVPLAMLKGRHCGWQCFTRLVWGSKRSDFAFGPPEESFELLKVFYPRSVLDAIYRNPCADDGPEGWYSGTPYGPVDIVPLAAPASLAGYDAAAFLGWNTFDEDDFARLLAFVETGGTLLLARPHLSTHVVRNQPAALPRSSQVLERLLGPVPLAGEKVVHRVGHGKVIFFPHDAYPGQQGLRAAYEDELRALGERVREAEAARGWVCGTDDVNFSVWDWADGRLRTLYLLNIDWWSGRPAAPVDFLFAGRRFPLEARAGTIETITASARCAVMPCGDDMDVLHIEETAAGIRVTVQSDAGGALRFFRPDADAPETIAVAEDGVRDVTVPW